MYILLMNFDFRMSGDSRKQRATIQPSYYESESEVEDQPQTSPKNEYEKRLQMLKKKGKLDEHYTKEQQRNQRRWTLMSAEKKAHNAHLGKLRMQKFREKKKKMKEQMARSRSKAKDLELENEAQRTYWRERKRVQRARKREAKDKKKEKKTKKRKKVGSEEESETDSYFSSPPARRQAARRGALPKDPNKFVETLQHIVKNATPHKVMKLKETGLINSPKTKKRHRFNEQLVQYMRKKNSELKKKRSTISRQKRLFIINSSKKAAEVVGMAEVRRGLGLTWSKLLKASTINEELEERKTRSDAISQEEKEAIEEFYEDLENSTPLASCSSTAGGMGRQVLKSSMKNLHNRFIHVTGKKIGLSLFKKLRPKHVLKMSLAKFRACLCQPCTNVEELKYTLERFAVRNGVSVPNLSLIDLSKATLCSTPTEACLNRSCLECGVEKVDQLYAPLLQFASSPLTWHRWENVETERKNAGKDTADKCENTEPKKKQKTTPSEEKLTTPYSRRKVSTRSKEKQTSGSKKKQEASGSKKKQEASGSKKKQTIGSKKKQTIGSKKKQTSGSKKKQEASGSKKKQEASGSKKKRETSGSKKGQSGAEKKTFHKEFLPRNGTVADLLSQLKTDMQSLSAHLFNATWQYRQYKLLKENLPPGAMLIIMDFAENYRTCYQNEIQSARWAYRQVTVHPFVCYYPCTQCGKLVTEYDVTISSDLKHDTHAVKQFTDTIIRDHVDRHNIQKLYVTSDGCASQYKSHRAFLNVSQGIQGIPVEWSYFGSGHGKGPADATSAVIKQGAYKAVKARNAVIKNAKDLHQYLCANMTIPPSESSSTEPCQSESSSNVPCLHTLRKFFFEADIDRLAKDTIKTTTLDGTRGLHCVSSTGTEGVIAVRNRSCHCSVCLGVQEGECESRQYVQDWEEVDFTVKNKTRKRNAEDDAQAKRKTRGKKHPTEAKKAKASSLRKIRRPSQDEVEETSLPSRKTRAFKRKLEFENDASPRKNRKTSLLSKKANKVNRTEPPKESKRNEHIIYQEGEEIDVSRITSQLIHSPYHKKLEVLESLDLCPITAPDTWNMIDLNPTPDSLSEELLTNVILPGKYKVPCIIDGDGNCLPRAGSVLAYGSQEHHEEMRLRIVDELVLHQQMYLSDEFLQRGWPEGLRPKPSVDGYLDMCNAYYRAHGTLTYEQMFNKEANDILKNSEFMGMFQLFALSSVLGCPIVSVYPALGDPLAQREMHRLILPRESRTLVPKFVMWTRTSRRSHDFWAPNHFIVLLPFDGAEDSTIDECSLVLVNFEHYYLCITLRSLM